MELTQVGPWSVEKKLGAGGMGTVYLGKHTETGQQAAVKVLPASLAREEGFIERFKREIASMEKLKSPHIVEFYESGNDGDTYYYAMEYVDGETLTARLKRDKRIPWPEVIDLSLQICRALKAAHNAGIIHRDLKPSNLMIASDGTVKLTDFGVAQVFASQKLTVTGGIVGTAEYMSPEQAKGQRATKKSDLYSLGAVIYVMLAGRPPFSGKTSLDVIHKHQFAQFDKPSMIVPEIPKLLDEIVCKLLEKDPDKRFPDAYVLSLRLAEVQKRFAWQAASNAPPSAAGTGSSVPNHAESTEPGLHARPVDDPNAVAPTVLIPEALGHNIPTGPTIAVPAAGASAPLAVTMTAPSTPSQDRTSDATHQIAMHSQGPGTIMRNLMRKVVSEEQLGGPLSRTFDNIWVLALSLALLIGGGVWWFQWRSQRSSNDSESVLVESEESLPELERVESDISKYLRVRDRRTLEFKNKLRQALLAYQWGDIERAEELLSGLLILSDSSSEFEKGRALSQRFLDALQSHRVDLAQSLNDSLDRAKKLAAEGHRPKAEKIWNAVVTLYADDPSAAPFVRQAREALEKGSTSTDEAIRSARPSSEARDGAASGPRSTNSDSTAHDQTEKEQTTK